MVTTFGKIVRILMSRNISTCTQPRRSKEFNRSTHGASARHLTPTSVMFAFPKRESHCSTGQFRPSLKGSIGEGPNHSNYSDQSSVRILGIQRKPRKAPSRKKPLQRSGSRPKIQEGAARKERKGKQTALRERGVRRSRIGAKDAIHAVKRFYA